jgi:hypothetical protein
MRQRKIQDNGQLYYRISAGSAPIYELFRKWSCYVRLG